MAKAETIERVLIAELEKRVEQRFSLMDARLERQFHDSERAAQLADSNMDRRLDVLNGHLQQAEADRAKFFTIVEHNLYRDGVEQRLMAVERWQYWIAGGLAVIVSLVGFGGMVLHIWR